MAQRFPTRTYIFGHPGLLGMTDAELAVLEADTIAICAEQESHWRDVDYRACVH
jgi:hypothetical protein